MDALPQPKPTLPQRWLPSSTLPPALIALATLLTYHRTIFFGFLNWDDTDYILNCPQIQAFTLANVGHFFTTPYFANYHPLTSLSFMADHAVWGIDPVGFHLTNVLLHTCNALWLYLLAKVLLTPTPRTANQTDAALAPIPPSALQPAPYLAATMAALIFSLHPLRVEAVAWISARKDLLCAFFALPTLIFYVRWARSSGLSHPTNSLHPSLRSQSYAIALLCFLCALLSKPMAITLPAVFLLLDVYLRRPLSPRLLFEKVPFFLLSMASAIITIWAQQRDGAIRLDLPLTLLDRIQTASLGPLHYLLLFVWPAHLSPLYSYGYPPQPLLPPQAAYAPVLLCALIAVPLFLLRRAPLWALALAAYLVMLLPVIQIVPIGRAYAADRYSYLPMIFLAMALARSFASLCAWCAQPAHRYRILSPILLALATIIVFGWAVLSYDFGNNWRTSLTLWQFAVRSNPQCAQSRAFLGSELLRIHKPAEAIEQFNRALALHPKHFEALSSRATARITTGDAKGAVADYQACLQIAPHYFPAHVNLATVLASLQCHDEAIHHFTQALTQAPQSPAILEKRARSMRYLGRLSEADADEASAKRLRSQP